MTSSERHRLSLIIATLGPSTDNEKELITMLMAGIARQWTDGVDIARVLFSDGEDVAKRRIDIFREQSKKRNLSTSIYLDTDGSDMDNYITFGNEISPEIMSFDIANGLDFFKMVKSKLGDSIKTCVRVKNGTSTDNLDDFFKECDYSMIELDSKIIHDDKIVSRSKDNMCEPIYLALMPTLMKGQVQSREENFEIGHTLEEGFDLIALYQETSHGPYAARSVKCIDEISVESEKLRVNPFQDLLDKFFSFFKKK
jgi:pyruvate kinase